MVFSSFPFLWIFLPVVLLGAVLTRKRGSNLFLLLMSLLFYAWGEPRYIVLLLFSITLNYFCGLLLDRLEGTGMRRLVLAAGVIANLAMLGYFKYFNFFAENLNGIFGQELIALRAIALPVGISFYTFQSISYLADLYRGVIQVQRSWLKLALYISFFPQLVAGPIVKYKDVRSYLDHRVLSEDQAVAGLKRFCFGLGKKVLLANTLGFTVDSILSHPISELSTALCWAAAVFYTLQIYFDFSGYSDMAIGLASVLGFRFQENFNLPYRAATVRDFWRRWHISLSTWFRDYVYIPLGGNRKGTFRTLLNLLIVFFLTGLWHGAQWNFVVWGLFHGLFLILERLTAPERVKSAPGKLLLRVYTLLVVCFGWVLFRADDLTMAGAQMSRMIRPAGSSVWNFSELVSPAALIVCAIGIFLSLGGGRFFSKPLKDRAETADVLSGIAAILCLFLSIVMLANASHNPFIYFRF